MKKFSVFFIFLAMIASLSFFPKISKTTVFADNRVNASSRSAILVDESCKNILYSNNEKERLPIASMCKIMTLLLSFDEIDRGNISLEDDVLVSENASGMGGSQVFLEANSTYKVKDLIKSIVIASANDACVAMAERISGNESFFTSKMNEKARELGMNDTLFANCTGLPKPEQYSCALDVAKMFSELIKHKDYFTFSNIWMDEIKHPNDRITQISNTNKLIRFYDGCDCGKTGYTSEAGHCLCASAYRNGIRLISVVIKEPDSKTRFKDISNMFNYGFDNYECKKIIDKEKPLNCTFNIEKGKKDSIEVMPENDFTILNKKGEKRDFEIIYTQNQSICAPIKQGDLVGYLTIYEKGTEIDKINVVSKENVDKKTFFDSINEIMNNWSVK